VFLVIDSWKSCCAFIGVTVGFHYSNLKRSKAGLWAEPISVNLRIGNRIRSITFRPYSGDVFILYEVLAFESYKISETSINPESVETIIDCGANIGITALYLAERYRNARIFCVEPDPQNFKLLKRNVEGEPRVIPIEAALVGCNTGQIYLSQDLPAWGNRIISDPNTRDAVPVAAITVAELCRRYSIDRIDLLKVDIEGAEEQVFSQANFLSNVRFIVIELHGEYTIEKFERDVRHMGFHVMPPGSHGGVRATTAFPVG
jgi:FkbM family methyltransferase